MYSLSDGDKQKKKNFKLLFNLENVQIRFAKPNVFGSFYSILVGLVYPLTRFAFFSPRTSQVLVS